MEVSVNCFRQAECKSGLQWHPHYDHNVKQNVSLSVCWQELFFLTSGPPAFFLLCHRSGSGCLATRLYIHKLICICILSMLHCLLPLLGKYYACARHLIQTHLTMYVCRILLCSFFFFPVSLLLLYCFFSLYNFLCDFARLLFKWPLAILLWPSFDPPPYRCYLWYHLPLSQGDQSAHTEQHTQLEPARPKTEFTHFWMFVDLSRSLSVSRVWYPQFHPVLKTVRAAQWPSVGVYEKFCSKSVTHLLVALPIASTNTQLIPN